MDIAITIFVILIIFVFIRYAAKSGQKIIDKQNERLNNAEPGEAKIISSEKFYLSGREKGETYQCLKFKLEVSNRFKSPYITENIWNVQPMGAANVQDGKTIAIKIDRDNPKIIYPSIPNIEYSWHGERLNNRITKAQK